MKSETLFHHAQLSGVLSPIEAFYTCRALAPSVRLVVQRVVHLCSVSTVLRLLQDGRNGMQLARFSCAPGALVLSSFPLSFSYLQSFLIISRFRAEHGVDQPLLRRRLYSVANLRIKPLEFSCEDQRADFFLKTCDMQSDSVHRGGNSTRMVIDRTFRNFHSRPPLLEALGTA